MPSPKFIGKKILLGVTGSIAAYKAPGILRALRQEGADVSVVMTPSATRFVTPLTFEVLSTHPVLVEVFEGRQDMPHLSLPEQADVFLVAPASAHTLAECAVGLAGHLLSTMMLTAKCPVVFAPAMDGDMWFHPTVQDHIQTLQKRGALILEPEEGLLASGRVGKGRLPSETAILAALESVLAPRHDLAGHRVLVSAGPTQEAIDPVRFISNRSSGKMGYAVAQAAVERGASVALVSGPTSLPAPIGVDLECVRTTEEMAKGLLSRLSWATIVVMAAAVADFRPTRTASQKLKKSSEALHVLELEPTEDIVATLGSRRSHQVLVGFAAETHDVVSAAKKKLQSKDVDLIVANQVGIPDSGFESDSNAATLIFRQGKIKELPLMPKRRLADHILDAAVEVCHNPPTR